MQARSFGDAARVQRGQRPRGGGAVPKARAVRALAAGLLAAAGVQLAPAREAAAAPPDDVPASPAPLITSCGGSGPDALEVTFARMPREPALRHAVCDWFRDEPWRVTFHSQEAALPRADVPASGQLLVTIFPLSADAAQLNITAPGRSPDWRPARWLERVPLRSGFDDVGIEVIAQSLHSTAQATLSRAQVPPPAPPAPPDPPATSALPTSGLPATASLAVEEPVLRAASSASGELDAPARVRYGLPLPVHTALGYHFHARGSEPVTHGPSLRIELDWLSRDVIFGSYIRTALFTSPRARAEGVELGLNGIGLGAGLAASVPSGRWTGRFALGSSVDLLGLDVGVVDDSETRSLGGGRPKPRFFMTSEAGLSRRFARVEVGLSALLRWQTSATHYEVLDEGEKRTILRASRLQPGGALEIAYVW